MTNRWNNKDTQKLPTVSSASSSTASSPTLAQSPPTSQAPPHQEPSSALLPVTSSPNMFYHHSNAYDPYLAMSHQVDHIIPHGPSGKKKRGARYFSPESSGSPQSRQPKQHQTREQNSGTMNTQKRSHPTKESDPIQDMEMELDFLRGECSTITIILSSLRTAFLRDGTDTFSTSNTFLPLTSSALSSLSSFSSFSLSSVTTMEKPSTSASTSMVSTFSTSPPSLEQQSQRKADRDKEMRVGYDELTLQVRHLEKKIEALENKICELSMDQNKKPRH
ncbi:hypothetical protein [Absidia glauca]|uniref:Uncharacterized protein n=1 Tax=Absidia glauca TaxID=4829 RepID=A0A163K926_ABSGL|nr:hypothetical protein [Absidia glauca]